MQIPPHLQSASPISPPQPTQSPPAAPIPIPIQYNPPPFLPITKAYLGAFTHPMTEQIAFHANTPHLSSHVGAR
ncbi:hypothetical protein P154DRAFT_522954 [Amniculicola lignicola CBS 123094]|uniref:Uncharacterized protein n=1 Tax=Amniculicola lignicola CBS 123094 TaxID=1392246 RepID=A0A6A5WQK9_9PLEO|nr:hypothetical protein P154DRAFT_522954 [Amniculicola lignicola CBS 123094]